MTHLRAKPMTILAALCGGLLLHACGGGDDDGNDVAPPGPPVTIVVSGPNAVSYWNEVATATVNQPASATGTPEEQRPNTAVDLATVHVAIYDAVMAITGTHQPYAITPTTTAAGASQEAAVAAAAYHVLRGLFPNRSAQYQSAYDAFVASMPADTASARGLAVGAEAAAGILALRANDGRAVVLAAFVTGTSPGQFRAVNPIGRPNPHIKPFVLTSLAFYGTPNIEFENTSTVTGTTRRFTSTTSFADETSMSRIYGGMHYRFSTVNGGALGRSVSHWVVTNKFQPR